MEEFKKNDKYDEAILKSNDRFKYFVKEVENMNLSTILNFQIPLEISKQLNEQNIQIVNWFKLFESFDICSVSDLSEKMDRVFVKFVFDKNTNQCKALKLLSKDKLNEIVIEGEELTDLINVLNLNGVDVNVPYRRYTINDYIRLDMFDKNFQTNSHEEILKNLQKMSCQLFKQDSFTLFYIKQMIKEKIMPLIEELKSIQKACDISEKQREINKLISCYKEILETKQYEYKLYQRAQDLKNGGYGAYVKYLTSMLDKFHHNRIDDTIVNKNEIKAKNCEQLMNDFNNNL